MFKNADTGDCRRGADLIYIKLRRRRLQQTCCIYFSFAPDAKAASFDADSARARMWGGLRSKSVT